ncbi:MAG: hypothetical protein R3D33_18500 [Hyphomicrobiaceae bacterium]
MRKVLAVPGGVLAGLVGVAALATPGSAALWSEVMVSKNVSCFADHYHYGSSSGMPSKKAATAEAIASWAGFVAWEYGDEYGNWRIAASKQVDCSGSGSSWSCQVSARPCHKVR